MATVPTMVSSVDKDIVTTSAMMMLAAMAVWLRRGGADSGSQGGRNRGRDGNSADAGGCNVRSHVVLAPSLAAVVTMTYMVAVTMLTNTVSAKTSS